jgi:hypothetical protein
LNERSETELAANIRQAEIQLQLVNSSNERLLEEHSAAFRWLMASFLAINGGGLLVVKDLGPPWNSSEMLAALSFYIGIVLALAIAWLGQRAARAALTPISKLSGFWSTVVATGEYDQEHHQEIISEFPKTLKKIRYAPLAGWGSLIAFSIGLGLIGWAQLAERDHDKTASAQSATLSKTEK